MSALLLIVGPASSASGAEFGIAPDGFSAQILNAEGQPEDRAGSHPDRLQINFALNLEGSQARDFEFELPPGLGGNPSAVPKCPPEMVENKEECPPETQVGVFEMVLSGGLKVKFPLFQLEPQPGQPIAFGSKPGLNLPFTSQIRPFDFGVTLKSNDLPKESITAGHFELWGIPADHQVGTSIPRRPFLTTPSTCGLAYFTFRTRSWDEEAPWLSASADNGTPLVGCEQLPFNPKIDLHLSDPVVDSPTGLRIDLSAPEEAEGSEFGYAQMKNVSVEFPKEIGVSLGGAEGLVACTDAQFGLGSIANAQCPPQSKIGTVTLASASLGSALTGAIYLGEERPGERMRTLLVAPAPGVEIKFVNSMQVNPVTGRLLTVMRDLPSVPIQLISLNFEGGPGALLASPLTCGPATAIARYEPYGGGPAVDASASVPISPLGQGSPCAAAPFSPQLVARSASRKAGHLTTFSTTLLRQPGEQLPSKFSTTLPTGLSARLGSVEACSSASAAAGTCAPESQIGSVAVDVGSGPNPATMQGNVYLTDPYRRAPFGFLMQIRAKVGPFDLGTMIFRAAAELDPRSGRLSVTTDRMPDQIEGVPIRIQTIQLSMDRPGFLRNPTSCAATGTEATFESQAGTRASATSPFKLSGCRKLGFKPDIEMAFLGKGQLRKHGTPALRVTSRFRKGDANLSAMKLSLPSVLKFGTGNLGQICPRRDAIEGRCPSSSRIGTAQARTPTLNEPLSGPIYMAQPSNSDGLPDMWVSLEGMGVHMEIRNRTLEAPDGHFVTQLTGLPDTPLSTFTMRLGGAKTQIISLKVNPCSQGRSRRFVSDVSTEGHNGAQHTSRVRVAMKTRCGKR